MSTTPVNRIPSGNSGLVQIGTHEELIRQRLEDARRRMEAEAGIQAREVTHFHKPIERAFTKKQRGETKQRRRFRPDRRPSARNLV